MEINKIQPEKNIYNKIDPSNYYKSVVKVIPSDMFTAVSVLCSVEGGYEDLFFYESVITDTQNGRYSIIAFEKNISLKFVNGFVERYQNGKTDVFECKNPIDVIKDETTNLKIETFEVDLPKFVGSFCLYSSYDFVKYTDGINVDSIIAKDTIQMPLAYMMFPKNIIVFDKLYDVCYLVVFSNADYETAILDLQKLEELVKFVAKPKSTHLLSGTIPQIYSKKHSIQIDADVIDVYSNITKQEYEDSVATCKQHIKAGDSFQIVPSIRFVKDCGADFNYISYYRSLRSINPSSFMFFIKICDGYVIGSSPEIMVRANENKVTIKPLAGTSRRGKTKAEDLEISKNLLSDKKEIAEHMVLLDLGRNDVGVVSLPNSVKVEKKMEIEYYSHVMHISSTVTGVLNEEKTMVDVFCAGFPAGTVSGGPKIKSMQIINVVEKINRSFYGGCVGYISKTMLETCISLRTSLIKDGVIYFQAGAGVVYDSDPEKEYEECKNKASALLKAYIKSFLIKNA